MSARIDNLARAVTEPPVALTAARQWQLRSPWLPLEGKLATDRLTDEV